MYTDEELLQYLRDFHEETNSTSRTEYDKWNGVSSVTLGNRFGSFGNAVDAAGISHDFVECPECDNLYPELGGHWRYNSSHRPRITDKQHEILTGLLMGDGSASKYNRGESSISVGMISEEFLHWVDKQMGCLSRGVYFYKSAEELAKKDRESGWNPTARAENYSDQYRWESRNHPEFTEYRKKWYPNGEKVFPDDLELNPLILKVWFCCDGTKKISDGGRSKVSFACSNEYDNVEKIRRIFDSIGVSPNFNRRISPKGDKMMDITFGVDDSEFLWDYMGDALPDFGNKWCSDDEFVSDDCWWTEGEIEILREKYPEQGSYIDGIDRTKSAISHKANRIGLSYYG